MGLFLVMCRVGCPILDRVDIVVVVGEYLGLVGIVHTTRLYTEM